MSLAEEMLANMSVSDDSASYLTGQEGHIVINESRIAIVPAELKTIAVTGDKDIETVTFDCVRYWDGNDLSTFAIYLNYVLPDKTEGTYIPEAITTSEGEDVFHFDWKIKNNITTKSGKISFAITAIKTKQNENGETVVDKQWGSLPNGDCSIALGLDIANVPSEEESGGVVAQLSAILEKIHSDVDEWIKTVLVQESGNSTTKAMSQKATTEAIAKAKNQAILYTDEKKEELDREISRNYQLAIKNSKRLTNLELGASETFEIDSSVAYVKDVPSASRPYAKIIEVGGMTYKEGDTLKSAPVTEVESVGVNLIPSAYRTPNGTTREGITFNASSDGSITLNGTDTNGTYFSLALCALVIGETYTFAIGGADSGIRAYIENGTGNYVYADSRGITFTARANSASTVLLVDAGISVSNKKLYPMLNKGTTALPYRPYTRNTLPIPEAVQALDGYGWGVSESVYNYIDFEKKQFVRKAKRLILNDQCDYELHTTNDYGIANFRCAVSDINGGPMLCNELPIQHSLIVDTRDEGVMPSTNGIFIRLFSSSASTVAELKAWLTEKPLEIVYQVTTPEVTDISDILTVDNYIEVEGNGSLTFENEYKYDVPSTIKYQVGG